MEHKDWLDSTDKVVGIGAALGLSAGVKWGWRRFAKYFQRKQMEKASREAILEMLPMLKAIKYEFSENGGGNTFGKLARIEANQKLIMATMNAYQNMNQLCDWKSDEEGKCIFASHAMCELVGRAQDEMIYDSWASWTTPDVFIAWQRSIELQIPYDYKYYFARKDGSQVYVHGHAEHLIIDGKYYGSIGKLTKI